MALHSLCISHRAAHRVASKCATSCLSCLISEYHNFLRSRDHPLPGRRRNRAASWKSRNSSLQSLRSALFLRHRCFRLLRQWHRLEFTWFYEKARIFPLSSANCHDHRGYLPYYLLRPQLRSIWPIHQRYHHTQPPCLRLH